MKQDIIDAINQLKIDIDEEMGDPRAKSVAKTKLDEARLWLLEARRLGGGHAA